MSNTIDIKNNIVHFGKDEIDIEKLAVLKWQHESHIIQDKHDIEVSDLFCWFLRFNMEYVDDVIVIKFGEGLSQHTWRDFAQTINFLKQFMKKNVKHTFKVADESNRFTEYFDQEIIFGEEYSRYLEKVKEE